MLSKQQNEATRQLSFIKNLLCLFYLCIFDAQIVWVGGCWNIMTNTRPEIPDSYSQGIHEKGPKLGTLSKEEGIFTEIQDCMVSFLEKGRQNACLKWLSEAVEFKIAIMFLFFLLNKGPQVWGGEVNQVCSFCYGPPSSSWQWVYWLRSKDARGCKLAVARIIGGC